MKQKVNKGSIDAEAVHGAAAERALTSQRETRRQRGRELRKTCPRSSHGEKVLGQAQRDPMALLEESKGQINDKNRGAVARWFRLIDEPTPRRIPELWDGRAGGRAAAAIEDALA